GERFFEDFNSHFWERPSKITYDTIYHCGETPFDIFHNTNTSTKRRRRNRTHHHLMKVTSERNENISETATTNNNQDNRRNENTSETATTNNNNQDNGNNVNNVNDVIVVNDGSGNSGHNANDVDGNLGSSSHCSAIDNATYPSSSELVNITSSLNISVSQNGSDVSMFDVKSSRPPSYMESINEEGG
ncbi:5835_t:CDS:2, partial [Acaulospora morrowiae]